MKTIICGAGDVGYSIADKFSKENFEVTLIDESDVNHVKDNAGITNTLIIIKGCTLLRSHIPSFFDTTYSYASDTI